MSLNPFKRKTETPATTLFDEAFLRRLERLTYRTPPTLRGQHMGERRSRNLRPSQDFNDHRPYAIGDDLRHVDWQVYARHGELFVKLGEATQRLDLHILLDASPSMSWVPTTHYDDSGEADVSPYSPTLKWNMARRLAGALGYLGLAGGDRVNITSFATMLGNKFGPTLGKSQVQRMLSYLTEMNPIAGGSPNERGDALALSLADYARNHPKGGVLLIISDLFDTLDEAGQDTSHYLAEGLKHLPTPRWQVLVMHLLTNHEVRPTLRGDYDFEDIETQESLPLRLNQTTISQYQERVERWCAAVQRACGTRGATYSRVLAEWPLEQKVIPYLRQRRLLE